MTTDTDELVAERGSTHGNWDTQAYVANRLKKAVRFDQYGVTLKLEARHAEAVDMILTKISRIVCGDAEFADHWDDIMGYAQLGKQGHVTPPSESKKGQDGP